LLILLFYVGGVAALGCEGGGIENTLCCCFCS